MLVSFLQPAEAAAVAGAGLMWLCPGMFLSPKDLSDKDIALREELEPPLSP